MVFFKFQKVRTYILVDFALVDDDFHFPHIFFGEHADVQRHPPTADTPHIAHLDFHNFRT